ncbi:MAG: rhodanese-like domain-containing protein [Luminiphilus sp.]|nr:rhodanese-like domain-containing protein [Luminiphilus sp.]
MVAVLALLPLHASMATDTAFDLKVAHENGAMLVDVRSEGEFSSGALEGADNYPVQGLPQSLIDAGITLDENIIVYCRSGRRSAQAKALLQAAGFKLVLNGGAMSALEAQINAGN